MKIKTAELKGKALDWALAKAMNADKVWIDHGYVDVNARFHLHVYEPFNHTDPALCLGLMNKFEIYIGWDVAGSTYAEPRNVPVTTKLKPCSSVEQAVARCVVAMKLGDEVDVPDELMGETS